MGLGSKIKDRVSGYRDKRRKRKEEKTGESPQDAEDTEGFKKEVKREQLEKDVEKLAGGISDYMGYIRAVFRTMGFIFIALGTLIIFGPAPLLKFIPLFVLSFAIMSSPSGAISTDEEVGLSVLKMILGILMIVTFAYVFFDMAGKAPALYISLVAIAFGFFFTVPDVVTKNRSDSASKMLETFNKAGEKLAEGLAKKLPGFGKSSIIFKFMMYFIMIIIVIYAVSVVLGFVGSAELAVSIGTLTTIALGAGMGIFSILIGLKLGRNYNGMLLGISGGIGLAAGAVALMSNTVMLIMFCMVVGIGILTSVPMDKAKTFIGIPILMVAMMTTTFAYPDIMGEAVFGDWWPQIDYSIDNTFGPLFENIQSPLGTLGQGYSCLINPQQCYVDFTPQTSTKESIRSVEVTRVDSIGTGTIDEFTDEVIVIVTVENKGKEDAENIKIMPKNPVYAQGTAEEESAGTVEIRCQDPCIIPKLISGELREFVLTYDITTIYGGNYISVGADIEYDLTLTGQVDVMVMDEEYYLKLSKNNELRRSEQITEDTGGPVRMGLALMRNEMPVRDDLEGVPVLLYLNNQGPGSIKEIDHSSVRVDINDLYVDTGETNMYCTPGAKPAEQEDLELKGLEKHLDNCEDYETFYGRTNEICPDGPEPVKTIEDAKATCTSKVPNIEVEQKTFSIIGEVTYTYTHGNERKIQVEFLEDTTGDGGGSGNGGGGSGACTDDDGGLNYFTEGTTTDSNGDYTDECDSDTGTVSEWYCSGDTASSFNYVCPNNCLGGLDAGRCNGGEYEVEGCHDYDGGLNYFEASWANKPGFMGSAKNDNCADSDGGARKTEPGDWVVEAYCKYNDIVDNWYTEYDYYECLHGCDCQGVICACKESP
ncbi:MAG: MFS transporter [Candidatus Aenigmarchaeota archaeon]|nr:MFS transporter [Candidatus Aenigmarchaeota archaeon]